MTIKEMREELRKMLSNAEGIDRREAENIADIIIEDVKGYNAADLVIYGHRELLPATQHRILGIAERVISGEPVQYAIGSSMFHGRRFAISPATLIPRPETSGLIDIVVDAMHNRKDCRLLDIGTGSGCIAISLALDLPFAQVDAIDVSEPAISLARENAKDLKARVNFYVQDVFTLDSKGRENYYDAIVSNPPYVMEKEKSTMESRVKDYEPASALFVPDSDPLIFYRAIAKFALSSLCEDGLLFFEINPLCKSMLIKMLKDIGFYDVQIVKDYLGVDRYAIIKK